MWASVDGGFPEDGTWHLELGDLFVDRLFPGRGLVGALRGQLKEAVEVLNPSGPVIAVDVLPPQGPSAKTDYGLSLSGWQLAASKILPGRKSPEVLNLANTIMRSIFVGSEGARAEMLREGLANLYLSIKAKGIGLLEFDAVEKVAQIGYEASIEPLREWLESGGLKER